MSHHSLFLDRYAFSNFQTPDLFIILCVPHMARVTCLICRLAGCVYVCVYKYQKWLSWQCFVRRKSEDCQFSAHLLALTVLITEWWQPMIVKIRVADWQHRLWHILKLNFPLSFCLSSFFLSSLPPLLLYAPPPLGISVWVNTSRMWTKKHTRAGINSPRGCVCVALCVALELSHIVVVRVCVGVCSVGSVARLRACACTRVYVCMRGDNEQRRDMSAREWRQQWLSHVGDRAGPAFQIWIEWKAEHEWQLALWLLFFKGCQ